MEYEVWHIDTDEKVGKLELANPIPEEVGAKVIVKVKGFFYHKAKGKFNAIEMSVCCMAPKNVAKYYALETNLPMPLLKQLVGFTPKIRIPTLMEMFHFGRPQ